MKIKVNIIKLCVLFWCGLLVWPAQAGNTGLTDGSTSAKGVVINSQDSTAQANKNSGDIAKTIETESLEQQLAAMRSERVKTEHYLEDVKEKLARMRGDLAGLDAIRTGLDADTSLILDALTNRIEQGLPVNREKRLAAVDSAQANLMDYDADLKDRLGSVLAVLLDNARYVGAIQLSEEDLTLDGRLVRVRALRLGDLFLLAASLDGRQAWRWNSRTKVFESVDRYAPEIRQAMEMIAGGRAAGLVRLPVGQISTLPGLAQ